MTTKSTETLQGRSLRYAAQEDEGPEPLRYHGDGAVQRRDAVPWRDDPDNPLSAAFRPLTERGERARARWWATHGKRAAREKAGRFDQ